MPLGEAHLHKFIADYVIEAPAAMVA